MMTVSLDHLLSLDAISKSFTTPHLLALNSYVQYILSRLRQDQIFIILPHSDLNPMNPGTLPREIYSEDGLTTFNSDKKLKGRPSKKEKNKKARLALDQLDDLLAVDSGITNTTRASRIDAKLSDYRESKLSFINSQGNASANVAQQASAEVLARLKGTQMLGSTTPTSVDSTGVLTAEKALESKNLGLLGFI